MKYYFAPMEGITTYIYRGAYHHHYGGVEKYFSPFLANRHLNFKEEGDVCPEHNQGIPLVPQILTNQSDVFLEIAHTMKEYGYTEVNLNLGCPSGTVTAKGRGAGFLDHYQELTHFLDEIFTHCELPISIKTRIGVEFLTEWEDLLKLYQKFPIKELTIHTRLQKEFYKGPTHPEAFRMAQEMLACPLCYNGDIVSMESLKEIQTKTEPLQSVMMGRGILRNPLLPAELTGEALCERNYKVFRAFHDEILQGYQEIMSGDQPVLHRMKELWTYMGSFVNASEKDLKKIHKTSRMADYLSVVRNIIPQ